MNAIELTRIQLELECIGLDLKGRMVRIPGANPDDIARFYITQHPDGYKAYYRDDLPRVVRDQLAALLPKQAFYDRETVKRILAQDAPCTRISAFKSYIFPTTLHQDQYPDAILLNASHRALIQAYDAKISPLRHPVFAIIADGRIVSTCESSRENDKSGEAWVRTLPEYRLRGYARQVTVAWADELRAHRKVAFYSHALDNIASYAVASSLGLKEFITGIAYS